MLLRRNSQISTFAGGNGGRIAINSPFIVAVPQENSDITANVFSGQGGSVKINATGIFGLVTRSRSELEQLLGTTDSTQLDTSRLPTNDIAIDPSLNGIVTINTPDVDPNQRLIQLPSNPVDASRQIDMSCNMQASLTRGANIPNNQIVEAQGWIIDAKGDIVLVAQAPTVNPLLRCP